MLHSRKYLALLRRRVHRSGLAQVGLLLGFWWLGGAVSTAAGLPFPGSVIGLLIVLALLLSGQVSVFSLRRGADLFLAEMLLFFVPAVLAVLDHREFLGLLGLKILLVITASTTAVVGTTAMTVELYDRRRRRS
jgi:holin-like protein